MEAPEKSANALRGSESDLVCTKNSGVVSQYISQFRLSPMIKPYEAPKSGKTTTAFNR